MWIWMIGQMLLHVRYASGDGAFPKPLSGPEEAECLERMWAGDRKARVKLIEHNLRLVAHVVRKYGNTAIGWEADDLISVGSIGLIKGLDTFNREKNAKLSTYLARCVENEVLMLLRADKKKQQEVSLQEPIGHNKEGDAILLDDVLEYDEESVLEQVYHSMGHKELEAGIGKVLTPREKEIVCRRYGLFGEEPETQRQVADRLNISRSYVSRIEKKALHKLKRLFDE
jgi:RNA polymerase sporulation-specific sigma factor